MSSSQFHLLRGRSAKGSFSGSSQSFGFLCGVPRLLYSFTIHMPTVIHKDIIHYIILYYEHFTFVLVGIILEYTLS